MGEENNDYQLNWNNEDLSNYLSEANSISGVIPANSSIEEMTSALKLILTTEEIKDMRQNRKERKTYSLCIFSMICGYLFLVFIILFFSGFKLGGFRMDNVILLALLGTTLVNVLGVFIIVVNYLFPKKKTLG